MVSDSKFHQSLNGLDENPLRRAWRGNKEGTIELASVPKFDSPYDEREWIKVCHYSRNFEANDLPSIHRLIWPLPSATGASSALVRVSLAISRFATRFSLIIIG